MKNENKNCFIILGHDHKFSKNPIKLTKKQLKDIKIGCLSDYKFEYMKDKGERK